MVGESVGANPVEAHAHGLFQNRFGHIEMYPAHRAQSVDQLLPSFPHTQPILPLHRTQAHVGRGGHTECTGHILGAGAQPVLLRTSTRHRQQPMPAADQQRTYSAWAAELVCRHRHHGGAHYRQIQLPRGVDRVSVEGHPRLPGDIGDLPNRLNGTGFVVGVHHRYQRGVGSQCSGHIRRADVPRRRGIYQGHLHAQVP
ncbi:Uncharacterised protein [Mycobacteroides abscessus subsp. abscessus]|nr:Uncharacterised protein [Mycobacteroides abscessus subsp. abscessus]